MSITAILSIKIYPTIIKITAVESIEMRAVEYTLLGSKLSF
jgi:hypothetical protein